MSETAESSNSRLTGRVELEPAPGMYASSQSEQKNGTNKPKREKRGRDIRLDAARDALAQLKQETSPEVKRELLRLIDKLTSGRKRKSPTKKGKAFE